MAQRSDKPRTRRHNGEGSTYFDKTTKRYRGVMRWTDAAGVLRRKTFSGATEGEVLAAMGDAQAERRKGKAPRVGREVTVADYAAKWLERVTPTIRPSTLVSYRGIVDGYIVPGIGRKAIRSVTVQDVESLVAKVHRSKPATAVYVRRVAGIMWHAAERDDLVDRNVARLASAPRVVRRQPVVLDAAQVQTLLGGVGEDTTGALIATLTLTGLRLGEATALDWADIDLEGHALTVRRTVSLGADGRRAIGEPKTRAGRRIVNLPALAVDVLTSQHERTGGAGLVFPSASGTPIHASNAGEALRDTCDRLGLPRVNPHALRHAYATLLVANGTDFHTVASVLGHSSTALVAQVYGHAVDANRRRAADTLDRVLGGVR